MMIIKQRKVMKKFILLGCLLSLGFVFASQENLVQSLLTEKKHVFDDLALEMQQELGSCIVREHPMMPLLLKKILQVSVLLMRPVGYVNSAQFNRAGDKVVTASSDCTSIWDAVNGNCLQELSHGKPSIYSAQFNYLGDKVVTASQDKTAKIWDVASGRCLQTLVGHTREVRSAEFSQQGDKIVTASDDCTAKVWDVVSGRCLGTLEEHAERVTSAHFSAAGDKILTASSASTIVWDLVRRQTYVRSFGSDPSFNVDHGLFVSVAQFNSSGDSVVTASADKTAKIWDAELGKCLQELKGHAAVIKLAEFNGSGDKVVTACWDKTARIWDVKSGICLQVLGHGDSLNTAHFNSSGDKVVTASSDTTSKIWDVSTGNCLWTIVGRSPISSAQFNQAGDKVVTSSSWDNNAKIWDVGRLKGLKHFLEDELTHQQAFLLVALYETVLCRAHVERHKMKAFNDGATHVKKDTIRLDLNNHPYLKEAFETVPHEIQDILRPFVVEGAPIASDNDDN
jgi:WD40 repeat protein